MSYMVLPLREIREALAGYMPAWSVLMLILPESIFFRARTSLHAIPIMPWMTADCELVNLHGFEWDGLMAYQDLCLDRSG